MRLEHRKIQQMVPGMDRSETGKEAVGVYQQAHHLQKLLDQHTESKKMNVRVKDVLNG